MFRGMNFWFTQLHRLGRWPLLKDEVGRMNDERGL